MKDKKLIRADFQEYINYLIEEHNIGENCSLNKVEVECYLDVDGILSNAISKYRKHKELSQGTVKDVLRKYDKHVGLNFRSSFV